MDTPKNETEEAVLSRSEKIKKEAKSIFWILLLVLVFRSSFFEPFRIPSGSMIPTLMIGDFILVNKFAYGFKIPFTDINLFGFDSNPVYVGGESDPKRGDVIVFKYPKDKSFNYIKRVIGLPGDKIEIRNKVVYVNGQEIKATEMDGKKYLDDMDDKFLGYNLRFFQTKTGEASHTIQHDTDQYYKVDYDSRVVPKGHFFVMGDNRDFSYDSRFWGFVPRQNIKGEAMFVWFSMIIPFGEHPFKFRPWRIGTVIR